MLIPLVLGVTGQWFGHDRRRGERVPAARDARRAARDERRGRRRRLLSRALEAGLACWRAWAGTQMRAADADRERVAERLRAALEEGRLDLHEYDERLQGAYAAKTYGDLDALLTDLPRGGAAGAGRRRRRSAGPAPDRRVAGARLAGPGCRPRWC